MTTLADMTSLSPGMARLSLVYQPVSSPFLSPHNVLSEYLDQR